MACVKTAKWDVGVHALATLPLSIFLLHQRVGEIRLLIIPFFNIVISLLCALALEGVHASFTRVNVFAPTIMAFLCVGLSVDYSLFLLTRFVEACNSGKSVHESLTTMLTSSGKV